MEINIVKIGAFIILIAVYLIVRKLFKKFADFTENIGQSTDHEGEIKQLNTKIISLEKQINNKE